MMAHQSEGEEADWEDEAESATELYPRYTHTHTHRKRPRISHTHTSIYIHSKI